jgi:hypothetical protein
MVAEATPIPLWLWMSILGKCRMAAGEKKIDNSIL